MSKKIIHRFHSSQAASTVCEAANKMTDIVLCVDNVPADDGRVGKWAICAPDNEILLDSTKQLLENVVITAIAVALAARLRQYEPNSPLAEIYHLREGFKPYRMAIAFKPHKS